ncbi:MAG: tRNA (N6-threonylcarbamoyladenosine(37)-N6)-methyltransferase TrmO [Aggregatilineales bacterium]
MSKEQYMIEPIGVIRSPLVSLVGAPKQGDEGGYDVWLEFTPQVIDALVGIAVGDEVIVLTWLHRADRDVLQVHPRKRIDQPKKGVFATRSPARPNPIGLHRVSVLAIDGHRVKVAPMEAIDGTPIVDIKPALMHINER